MFIRVSSVDPYSTGLALMLSVRLWFHTNQMTAKHIQLCVSGTYPYFHFYFLGTQVLPDMSGICAGLKACCGEEGPPPAMRDLCHSL